MMTVGNLLGCPGLGLYQLHLLFSVIAEYLIIDVECLSTGVISGRIDANDAERTWTLLLSSKVFCAMSIVWDMRE